MFKKFLKNLLKISVVLIILSLIVSTVVLSIALYAKTKDYNNLQRDFDNVLEGENSDGNQVIGKVKELEDKIADLETENQELENDKSNIEKQLQKYASAGIVKGSIVPIVISGGSFNKYQFVCAENVQNKSSRFCTSVSAVTRNYSLILPAGSYNVFAVNIDDESKDLVQEPKAYFTEYVKCTQEKDLSECTDALSANLVNVEVKADSLTNGIDPIDWR